jgi:hypothetical protein
MRFLGLLRFPVAFVTWRLLTDVVALWGVVMRCAAGLFRSVAACVILGGIGLAAGAARGADLPVKAPAQAGCIQAVDGINGKVAGWGGSFASNSIYGGSGSLALPLGCEFGAQIDGTAASFDNRFLGTIAGHVFWRDPAKALLGIYGSFTDWNQVGGVRTGHVGPEAEWYSGRWTLQGVAGAEFGNNASGIVGGLTETYNVKTRFFDEVNLAYYLQDNFKVYVGHRYLGGENALALGGEYGIPMNHGVMAALFAEGRIGESNVSGVWGGLRFYFGQKDKTLIRRHREDDPTDWTVGNNGSSNTGTSTPTTTPTCQYGGTYPDCSGPPEPE